MKFTKYKSILESPLYFASTVYEDKEQMMNFSCKESFTYSYKEDVKNIWAIPSQKIQELIFAINRVEKSLKIPESKFEEYQFEFKLATSLQYFVITNDFWFKQGKAYVDMFCCIWRTLVSLSAESLNQISDFTKIPNSKYFDEDKKVLWILSQTHNWPKMFHNWPTDKLRQHDFIFSNDFGRYVNGWNSKMYQYYVSDRDFRDSIDRFRMSLLEVKTKVAKKSLTTKKRAVSSKP